MFVSLPELLTTNFTGGSKVVSVAFPKIISGYLTNHDKAMSITINPKIRVIPQRIIQLGTAEIISCTSSERIEAPSNSPEGGRPLSLTADDEYLFSFSISVVSGI